MGISAKIAQQSKPNKALYEQMCGFLTYSHWIGPIPFPWDQNPIVSRLWVAIRSEWLRVILQILQFHQFSTAIYTKIIRYTWQIFLGFWKVSTLHSSMKLARRCALASKWRNRQHLSYNILDFCNLINFQLKISP